ncbi:hypothetical protein GIB67_023758 [Kingdonia uniflora]|uniref:Uncharacterized protein n=1 Tax=Kingdonia uniflora TaxID=39325 RepID=A0A7J7LG09_9MAGN|nr:hypothetical protein GIB67_023758 [Kingdonia uniflora]
MIIAMANLTANLTINNHKFFGIELASFIDLIPLHRFRLSVANATILEAIVGFPVVDMADLSSSYCMQMPTLINTIVNHSEVPPFIKLTIAGVTVDVPLKLDLSYDG